MGVCKPVMLRLWDMRQNIKAEDNLKALAITIMRNNMLFLFPLYAFFSGLSRGRPAFFSVLLS